jgi:tRNA A37 threonylcarbamoyladenosine dehydratase
MKSKYLEHYQQCVNEIDDFLEYRYRAYEKEEMKDYIMNCIDKLNEKLKGVSNENID